ncbi:MAG: RibD family protein [Clostridia bacterium]|nr:RibD family protein [Clostridia bacterium]
MDRPYVICHMLSTLDGRISGRAMSCEGARQAQKEYGRLRREYDCDATLYGTITAEEVCAEGFVGKLPRMGTKQPRTDYAAQPDADRFIVAVDAAGQLAWKDKVVEIPGRPRAHIIEVLTESVSDEYIAYLRELDISYVFAGKEKLNCALALQKLGALFPIRKLMLAGGGVMNGSMLREGLVDELSVVLLPTIEGDRRAAALAEYTGKSAPQTPAAFSLISAEPMGDALWLRYRRREGRKDEAK